MRKVYRSKENTEYWDDRWSNVGVDLEAFRNKNIYPVKYADLAVEKDKRVLEAGCGTGRLYFHYERQGVDIEGIEFSQVAVDNIIAENPEARVIRGDVAAMPYDDERYDVVLAFGLFHNLENNFEEAFSEVGRVLKPNGVLVASVRCDSFENRLVEFIVKRRNHGKTFDQFHKWQISSREFGNFLKKHQLTVEQQFFVRNVSFLFKFNIFRSKNLKGSNFNEATARSQGFQLNKLGKTLDACLHSWFPKQFSNVIVAVARKK